MSLLSGLCRKVALPSVRLLTSRTPSLISHQPQFKCHAILSHVRATPYLSARVFSSNITPDNEPVKLTIFQRFKKMYKDYWYVLVPVHVATSCCWFGGFFYLSSSGIDIAAILELMNFSDTIVEEIRAKTNTTTGHVTIAYLLYKVFTPARYTVTLGGTTWAINYLTTRGIIKPMPEKAKFKQMIKQRADSMRTAKDGFVERMFKKKS